MTYNNILCACCLLCVFASTVRFLGNNPAAGAGLVWVGAGCVSSCYGGHSVEETPGSIPNPEAKLDCADGTALGRVWESRSPPDIFTGSGGVLEPLKRVFASSTPFFHAREQGECP